MNKLAVLQMVSINNIEDNLQSARRLITEAAATGAKLAILPENFAVFSNKNVSDHAELNGSGHIQGFLAELARQYSIWLVAGTIPLKQRPDGSDVPDGRVRAASLVFDDKGDQQARYDKMHMFDVSVNDAQGNYLESRFYEPGEGLVVLDSPVGKLGLSICYDLRFPELYRGLIDLGAEVITCPSAFTHVTGEAHWEVLLRARAIENTCYMVAADQGGTHSPKRETWGHSMIVDPWGVVLVEANKGEGCHVADIDLEKSNEIKLSLPSLKHRRIK